MGYIYKRFYPASNLQHPPLQVDEQKFYSVGKIVRTSDERFQILELPIGTWTQTYIEKYMMIFAEGNDKLKPLFKVLP